MTLLDNETTRQRSTHRPLEPGEAVTYALVVVDGPDRGRRLFFDETLPPRVLVGSSPLCSLRLDDREVSRRHLALSVGEDGLEVEDLGSTNGTSVGGVRVRTCVVRGGQEILVGGSRLRVVQVPVARGLGEPVVDVDAPVVLHAFGRMVGRSAIMQRIFALCERAAASSEPLLVEGRTGTGKDLLAECIHEASAHASGPFVVLDCATLVADEVDRVLFGTEGLPGYLEQAAGGTLVLDEIGELEPSAQAKLSGALARRSFRRTGTTTTVPLEARIVATSRKDLERDIELGAFREDLLFRVAVLRIELPSLTSRAGDLEALVAHFWSSTGGIGEVPDDLAAAARAREAWPGNVRELENFVARRVALGTLSSSPVTGLRGEVDVIERVLAENLTFPSARERVVAEFERRFVARALANSGGNVGRAAASSGIARRYFQLIRARLGSSPGLSPRET